ncbi:4-alpha-glucanotransferase [Nocardioides sp. AN3]
MSTDPAHARGAVDAWGLQRDWVDADDHPQRVDEVTLDRLRELIGTPPEDLEDRAPLVTRPGRRLGLGALEVRCEDGVRRTIEDEVPSDFPLGYHRVEVGGHDRLLVVSPGRCHQPSEQAWGWTVQLYAVRSQDSWGIGDLGDLRVLREWTERLGGGFLLVNPLHATAPTLPQEPSPYLPATRRFLSPLYLRLDQVTSDLRAEVDRLRRESTLDRDTVWRLKRRALKAACDLDAPDFRAWRGKAARPLEDWATWCALAEEHGPDWRSWPEELRRPDGPAVAAYARTHAARVDFHAWLQWLLDHQLREASGELTLIQDLPIGVAGGGADAWAWQHVLAHGVSVGAPPDMMNSTGQDWGSPPFVPWRLRADEYAPFIESVRATIAGAGGLRIDHVMGLFRLWWIPEGSAPTEGAYVRYPADDLLDIVALESHRAGAVVVGEDLGTVEPGVREALAERGILSYRVLWFEDEDPAEWPREALAAVTTHDLPTVAGLWSGADAEEQAATTGMTEDDIAAGREELLGRLRRTGLAAEASVDQAIRTAYEQLAKAPSLLLAASLDDAVGAQRRPNIPGTTDRDNWRIPLPLPLEQLLEDPGVRELARLLADHAER